LLIYYRKFIEESLGHEAAEKAVAGGITTGEKISRSTLEEEARQTTLRGHGTPEERFWQRQQGQAETILIGKRYIEQVGPQLNDEASGTDIFRLRLQQRSPKRNCEGTNGVRRRYLIRSTGRGRG
jgi:hypothetical protein